MVLRSGVTWRHGTRNRHGRQRARCGPRAGAPPRVPRDTESTPAGRESPGPLSRRTGSDLLMRSRAQRRADKHLAARVRAEGSDVGERIAAGDPAARAGAGRRRLTRLAVVLLGVGCLGIIAGAFGFSASQATPAAPATIQPRGAAASATYPSDSATSLKLTVPPGRSPVMCWSHRWVSASPVRRPSRP